MGRFTFAFLSALTLFAAESPTERLVKEVQHQLVTPPYYSVFDNLAYRVDRAKVTLFGQVVRPTLKGDAESSVKIFEPWSNSQMDPGAHTRFN